MTIVCIRRGKRKVVGCLLFLFAVHLYVSSDLHRWQAPPLAAARSRRPKSKATHKAMYCIYQAKPKKLHTSMSLGLKCLLPPSPPSMKSFSWLTRSVCNLSVLKPFFFFLFSFCPPRFRRRQAKWKPKKGRWNAKPSSSKSDSLNSFLLPLSSSERKRKRMDITHRRNAILRPNKRKLKL